MREWALVAVLMTCTTATAERLQAPPLDQSVQSPRQFERLQPHAALPAPLVATVQQDLTIFGTPIVELPVPLNPAPKAGSYQQTCRDISQVQRIRQGTSWTMTWLTARCQPTQQNVTTLIDPDYCAGDIVNNNGFLECQRSEGRVLGRVMFPLPAGSWRQSCRDAYHHVQARQIRAFCRTASGIWRHTTLNTATFPCTSASNDDGWLSCDSAAPLPKGPWRAHCKEAAVPQTDLPFAAICRRQSDGVWQRTTVSASCTQPVDVLDGFLACGLITGLPGGDWPNRCRPINWDAMQPAITLICDQRSIAFRVPLEVCTKPVTLNYDGSGERGFVCPQ